MSDRSSSHLSRLNISRVPHLPGLDGMRALAVVAVMVYHANSGWLHGGFLGVEVFFVISGYLITLLLVAEHERDDSIDLKAFWIRRFRRLLPALYLMLVLVIVYLAVFFRQAQGRVRGDVIAGLTYVSNWFQIWVGAGYTASEAFAPLRHLWSLAVEEQFYLIWPLVMVAILRRGRAHLPRVALWLFGIAVFINVVIAVLFVPGDIDSVCTPDTMNGYWSIAGRCISINDTLYLSTVTRAGGLLLGAALAMVWRPVAVMRGPMRDKGRQLDLLALGGFVILAMLMWWVHLADPAENSLTGSQFDPWLFRGPGHGDDHHCGHPPWGHHRATARQPGAVVGGYPQLWPVPVPLADLPDHPRAGGREDEPRPVRAGDDHHGADHRTQLPPRRDARAQGCDRAVDAPRVPPAQCGAGRGP
jgi:peptidoglycan/LPS O-acetylase OafA/YrhL